MEKERSGSKQLYCLSVLKEIVTSWERNMDRLLSILLQLDKLYFSSQHEIPSIVVNYKGLSHHRPHRPH